MSISIRQVKGIGPATKEQLIEKGFTTVERIAEATLQELMAVPGFGKFRANQAIEHARQLLAEFSGPAKDDKPEEISGTVQVENETATSKPKKEKKKKADKKKIKAKKEKSKKKDQKKKGKKGNNKRGKDKKKGKKKASK